jgi:hypothetical protein
MALRDAALWRSMTVNATGDLAMPEPTPIVITDLRISFFRLVMFFVKAALAAIPAAIIVAIILTVLGAILIVALGGSPSWMIHRWSL